MRVRIFLNQGFSNFLFKRALETWKVSNLWQSILESSIINFEGEKSFAEHLLPNLILSLNDTRY